MASRFNLFDWFWQVMGGPISPGPLPLPYPPLPRPILPVPPQPPVPTLGPAGEAGEAIDAINRARADFGRLPVRDDPSLEITATQWAGALAVRGVLDHGNFGGRIWAVHPNAPAGENIAEGQPTATRAVADWANDAAHLAILLGDWDSAGFGHAIAADGTHFWVADFCKVKT